eukprot:8920282-Karenia_brevis.AAC.1
MTDVNASQQGHQTLQCKAWGAHCACRGSSLPELGMYFSGRLPSGMRNAECSMWEVLLGELPSGMWN